MLQQQAGPFSQGSIQSILTSRRPPVGIVVSLTPGHIVCRGVHAAAWRTVFPSCCGNGVSSRSKRLLLGLSLSPRVGMNSRPCSTRFPSRRPPGFTRMGRAFFRGIEWSVLPQVRSSGYKLMGRSKFAGMGFFQVPVFLSVHLSS